jgi:hypothetical protein
MSLPLVLVLWLAASIPLAVVTGRAIGRQATLTTSEPSELRDRLAEVELSEIPRVRRAIGGWVDDPYLAGELREGRAPAWVARLDRPASRCRPEEQGTDGGSSRSFSGLIP